MARIRYLRREDLSSDHQDLLARDINLFRALVNSPNCARAFLGIARHIRHQSRLDPRLRELAIIQVGFMVGSPYEYSHHVKIGEDFGVTARDLEDLVRETRGQASGLDEPARTVLKAAREMTQGTSISPETYRALEAFLDPEGMIEFVTTVGFYNGVVKILASLEIDVEDEYLPYLDEAFQERLKALNGVA